MAAPTIDPTTSVLAMTRGRFFVYQPTASDSPTSWSATNLPTGMSINTTTGRISGTPTQTGVYNIPLIATNGTGDSPTVNIIMGVQTGNVDVELDVGSIEMDMDWRSGAVSVKGAQVVTEADSIFSVHTRGAPIVWVKRDEKFLLSFGCKKDGRLQDMSLATLNLCVKEYEPEAKYAINDGTFELTGSEDTTRYKTILDLTSDSFDALLSNYEDDDGTFVDLLAEAELLYNYDDGGGNQVLTRKSRSFVLRLERDLN